MMINSNISKKSIAFIAVILIIIGITAGYTIQYILSNMGGTMNVTLKEANIQFMSADRNVSSGYVLRNTTYLSTFAYKIELSEWVTATNWTSPAAFAIVNTQPTNMTISKIEVTGDTNGYLRVWLHKNMSRPCNSSMMPPDLVCESSADKQIYYDGTQSFNYGNSGWRLYRGLGYNASIGNLTYTDDGTESHAINALWNDTLNIWVYNKTIGIGSNLANNDTANFVWVEIEVVVPDGASDNSYSGNLVVYFKAED